MNNLYLILIGIFVGIMIMIILFWYFIKPKILESIGTEIERRTDTNPKLNQIKSKIKQTNFDINSYSFEPIDEVPSFYEESNASVI